MTKGTIFMPNIHLSMRATWHRPTGCSDNVMHSQFDKRSIYDSCIGFLKRFYFFYTVLGYVLHMYSTTVPLLFTYLHKYRCLMLFNLWQQMCQPTFWYCKHVENTFMFTCICIFHSTFPLCATMCRCVLQEACSLLKYAWWPSIVGGPYKLCN